MFSGIDQFITAYRAGLKKNKKHFLWGDEVEYLLVYVPESGEETVKLSLRAAELLENVRRKQSFRFSFVFQLFFALWATFSEQNDSKTADSDASTNGGHVDPPVPGHQFAPPNFLPEYGSFMIEATPGEPYGDRTSDLLLVEDNMRLRRAILEAHLRPGEKIVTLGSFPRLGAGDFVHEPSAQGKPLTSGGPVAASAYVPDAVINPHPRFGTLTQNIRMRRGENVDIRVPLMQDENTSKFRGCLGDFGVFWAFVGMDSFFHRNRAFYHPK